MHAKHALIGIIAIAVTAVAVVLGVRPLLGGALTGLPYTYATAAFNDIGTLRPMLQVRENSVVVGKVADVKYENHHAVVTLRLDGHHPIYRNASVQVLDESALAQKFVNLDPGSPEAGPLGTAVIDETHTPTADASNLDQLLNVFDPQTRVNLQSAVRELGTGLAGHGGDINTAVRAAPGMLGDLGQVSGALSTPDARVPALLASANQLTGHFGGHDQQLSDLVRDADSTLRAVQTQGGQPLSDTLADLPPTLRDARTALQALNGPLADVHSAVSTLQPGAAALGRATPDVRGVLREAVPPLDEVPDVADKAKPAVGDLTDTMSTLQPLAPQLRETVGHTKDLMAGLSPYSYDVGRFFGQQDLLSGEFAPDKHYFSAELPFPGLYAASAPDPLAGKAFYPTPNHAAATRPEGQHPDGGDK
ncbi:MlaD family protein [Actinomycetospora endophytica]|uniref:MlaD family protein n=1 Tax=Actinomycetospora endophytica TaxID=2291215 RepID=A0ABS8PJA4_9PSEU|nr:MlaD family protein [Actinomycetospora endophytica]MCD2198244.1 MlaD family protein [Actinomycetospora endophytica]